MSNRHAFQPPLVVAAVSALLDRSARNRLGRGKSLGEALVLFEFNLSSVVVDGESVSERIVLSTEFTLSKSIPSSPPSSVRDTLEHDTIGLSSLVVSLGEVLTESRGPDGGRGSSSKQELDDVSTFLLILASSLEEVLLRVGV
jgi:hypothetical protein